MSTLVILKNQTPHGIFISQIELLQRFINDSIEKYEKSANEMSSKFDETLGIESSDSKTYHDGYWDNACNFPDLIKKSILITLHSFLEITLANISLEVEKIFNLNIKKSSNESDIGFYRRCIKSGLGNIDDFNLWSIIENNRKIRNCFVHSNGIILKNKIKQFELIFELDKKEEDREINPLLLINSKNEIIIYDSQYLIDYSETIKNFCNLLFDMLNKYQNSSLS